VSLWFRNRTKRAAIFVAASLSILLLVLVFTGAASGLTSQVRKVADLTHGSWGPSANHVGGGTVRIRLIGDWSTSLMPPTGPNNPSLNVASALYDKLVDIDTSGKVIPYLATSWKVSPTQIVFHLRKGPTCDDGTPITPAVVAQGINYWVSQKSVWTTVAMGAGPISATSSNKAGTVTVTTGTPNNDLLSAFTNKFAAVVCPAGLNPTATADSLHGYGSGPYEITSAVHNQTVTMKLRPNWNWGPMGVTAKQLPQTIEWQVVPTEATAANELLAGQLDIGEVSGQDISRVLSNKSLLAFRYASTAPNLIQLNLAHPLLQNKTIRKAILTAIDPQKYGQADLGPYGTVPKSIFGKTMECYSDESSLMPKTNPKTAQQLLESAGYQLVNGKMMKDGQQLTLTVLGALTQGSGPEYLADALNSIGINAQLQDLPYANFAAGLRAGSWDVIAPVYSDASPGPSGIIRYLHGAVPASGGYNFGHITNNIWERLIRYAYEGKSANGTCSLWKSVQQFFFQNYYGLPGPAQDSYFFTRGYDVKAQTDIISAWSLGKRKS
jgi:peptide/nickel transport system substrate-binding protein